MKISKHKSGRLYTTLTIRGNKKFIYGETADEVEAKYTELKYKHRQGYNITDNPTLKEYMIDWYTAFKKGKGAIKTQKMYQNCINNHINPVLGKQKVKSITSTQVQNFLNNIDGSKSLVHKVRITLNQIFKQAMADRIISFNPVAGTKIIAPDEPKRKFLTPFQRELMLEILKEHRAYPLVFAILHTGMRMGEALALTWNDIDFENKIIKVSKAFEFEKSKPKLKQPKTERGTRTIPMPKALFGFLTAYKTTSSIYVFPGHAGGPKGLSEVTRIWRSAQKTIKRWFKENKEMQEQKFHLTFRLLRHTYCTGLYDLGIDELSAAEIMGHDVLVMKRIYTHIQDERKKKTALKIESLYQEQLGNAKEQ